MHWLSRYFFGVEPAPWTEGGTWHLAWRAMPRQDGLFVLALAILGTFAIVLLLYRWENRGLSLPVRIGLGCLRMIVLLGVLAMLLEPMLVFSKTDQEPSNLLVLVDRSESMNLADAYVDANRGQKLAAALGLAKGPGELAERSRAWLAEKAIGNVTGQLASDGDRVIRVQDFAQQLLSEAATTQPSTRPTSEAAAESKSTTAIGAAVRQAITAYRGQPLAGVLVVTDGQSNAGESPTKAAEFAAAEGVPVVSLAVGTPEGPRNAKVVKIESNPVVFVRDPNRLRVLVESRGMTNAQATLVLEKRRDGGPWEDVARQPITLEEAGRVMEVPFDFKEDRPTKLDFRARLIDAGVELTDADNTATADVRVIRQKIKVLFVAGSTFPEVEFIRNALLRDNSVAVSTWLQTADANYSHPGNPTIRRLPQTQEELDDFDCVVMYDPDPTLWAPEFPVMLQKFVAEAGGGLVYVAGERNTKNAFDHPDDPSAAYIGLLPVTSEPGLYHTDVSVQLSSKAPWNLEITPEGRADPVFQFSAKAEENETVLNNLPGMFWHFPVTRARPGATVLARHGDPRMRNENGNHVLLATQLVGPGRTFFIGFDSTYRWRYLSEQYFDGFWARVIDRAGRNKQLGGRYPFTLSTDRASYRPGTQVTLTARFDHATDRDSGLDSMRGEVELADQPPIPVTLTPKAGEQGVFEATLEATNPGQYFVRVWPGADDTRTPTGATPRAATMQFQVELPNLEYEHPTLDRAPLEAMAKLTGGAVFDLEDAVIIPTAFKTKRVARVLEDRQEIFDAPAIFGTVLLALFVEWVLRKKFRMV